MNSAADGLAHYLIEQLGEAIGSAGTIAALVTLCVLAVTSNARLLLLSGVLAGLLIPTYELGSDYLVSSRQMSVDY